MKRWCMAVVMLLLALGFAQTRDEIRLTLEAFRVITVQEEGRAVERLEAALDARPGQLIEYRLQARNTTDAALQRVALIIPIPPTTAYQALSAQPLRLGEALITPEFSFDGGLSYGRPPLKRRVRVIEGGREVEREVEVKPEEYTHARWVLPQLGPRQAVVLRLRTVVR